MARQRAQKFNSVEGIVKTIADAAQPLPQLPPHVKLRDQDKPFFDAILLERARKEWTTNTLAIAAQLARVQADLQHEAELLNNEPSVVEAPNGKLMPNPRVSILSMLTTRQRSLIGLLHMGGDALPTDYTAKMMKQRSAERFFRAQMGEMREQEAVPEKPADLLAR